MFKTHVRKFYKHYATGAYGKSLHMWLCLHMVYSSTCMGGDPGRGGEDISPLNKGYGGNCTLYPPPIREINPADSEML